MLEAIGWKNWAGTLRQDPYQAVIDLLRGAADIFPFERLTPADFLLHVLPRSSFIVQRAPPLGEPLSAATEDAFTTDLSELLDRGLVTWFGAQAKVAHPPSEKLSAYAAQVCEAIDLLSYFVLPLTRATLLENQDQWLKWLAPLAISASRDPAQDYLKVLALSSTPSGATQRDN